MLEWLGEVAKRTRRFKERKVRENETNTYILEIKSP